MGVERMKNDVKYYHDLMMDALYYDELFQSRFCANCPALRQMSGTFECVNNCSPCDDICIKKQEYFNIEEAVLTAANVVITTLS